jgi:hypothetical protein
MQSKIDIHSLDSPLQANVTAIVSSPPKFVGKKPVFEETFQAIMRRNIKNSKFVVVMVFLMVEPVVMPILPI